MSISFQLQPNLDSQLIQLRPLRNEDHDRLYAVAADPLIWQQHPASNRHMATEFGRYFSDAMQSGGALLIVDATNHQPIGSSRYHGYDAANSSVEIGWTFLARPYWGGQYNAELKRLMLAHAFKFVDTVLFYIDPNNIRSQKSVEKIGGKRDALPDAEGRVVYRVSPS